MKMPCGGCGKYLAGPYYQTEMGCFFCWSSQHSDKYGGDYWDEAGKITPTKEVAKPIADNPVAPSAVALASTTNHGPVAKGHELGDLVKQALDKVGINEKRIKEYLGVPCGCTERQEKLNRLSRWVKKILKRG